MALPRPRAVVAAHPYSISQLPARDELRLTVKDLGDHSGALARLRPGTRVAIEGPYGAFTADHSSARGVLAIAAGVGSTPVRAFVEDLAEDSAPIVVLRAATAGAVPLFEDIETLVRRRGGTVHHVSGPRDEVRLDAAALLSFAPDLRQRMSVRCALRRRERRRRHRR